MDSFRFLWRGRIEVFLLLALPFALGLKMVAPCLVPCDDTWQKCILFLIVLLQMTQTCSHSVSHLSLCQLMWNPLRKNFSELLVIFDNGMHGALANANLNTNLFLFDLSVFPDQTINSHSHIRRNGSMDLSLEQIVLQWCASFAESLVPLLHTCQGHTIFAIHSGHETMNFACSSILSHWEMNHTSLLFFVCLHFQSWTITFYTMLAFRAIKKQLCGPVRFNYACLLSTDDIIDT